MTFAVSLTLLYFGAAVCFQPLVSAIMYIGQNWLRLPRARQATVGSTMARATFAPLARQRW